MRRTNNKIQCLEKRKSLVLRTKKKKTLSFAELVWKKQEEREEETTIEFQMDNEEDKTEESLKEPFKDPKEKSKEQDEINSNQKQKIRDLGYRKNEVI